MASVHVTTGPEMSFLSEQTSITLLPEEKRFDDVLCDILQKVVQMWENSLGTYTKKDIMSNVKYLST